MKLIPVPKKTGNKKSFQEQKDATFESTSTIDGIIKPDKLDPHTFKVYIKLANRRYISWSYRNDTEISIIKIKKDTGKTVKTTKSGKTEADVGYYRSVHYWPDDDTHMIIGITSVDKSTLVNFVVGDKMHKGWKILNGSISKTTYGKKEDKKEIGMVIKREEPPVKKAVNVATKTEEEE